MTGKRYWAVVIKQSVITLLLVFALTFVWQKWIADDLYSAPVESGLIMVAAYLIVSLVIGILHGASALIYLWLFGGSDMSAGILEQFRAMKMPPPHDYDQKDFSYLASLADDEEMPAEARVKAALFHGSWETLIAKAGIFRGLALRKAADDAVLRYYQEAPRRAA